MKITGEAKLDAQREAELDPRGFLVSLSGGEKAEARGEGDETVFSLDTALSLRLKRTRHVEREAPSVEALAHMQFQRPGEARPSAEAKRRALRDRVDGLTAAELSEDILHAGALRKGRAGHEWLWRATGLLRLQPELAHDLARVYFDDESDADARMLILDVLTSVGHAEAQDAMRTILGSPDAVANATYGQELQRLGVLDRPEPATAELAAKQLATLEDEKLQSAAANALAGTCHGLAARGEHALAEKLMAPVVERLAAATTEDDVARALGALGNAGLPGHVDALAPYVTDERVAIRQKLAHALRRTDTTAARDLLWALAQDDNALVRSVAVTSLAGQGLTQPDLETLATWVEQGVLTEPNFSRLATLASRAQTSAPGAGLALLDRMIEQPIDSPELAYRLQTLRESL